MTHKSSTTLTTPLRTFAAISAALLSTMLFVACSSGPQAALPFAPSALPSSMLPLEAADGIDAWGTLGKGNDKDRDKGDKGKDDDASTTVPDASTTVTIEGVISAATGACPAKTFVVGTQSVVTDAATTFEGGLCAQLVPLAEVEVRAVRCTDGTLLAKDVEFEDDDADGDTEDADDDDTENEEQREIPTTVRGLSTAPCPTFAGSARL